jgi:hypothetical protein
MWRVLLSSNSSGCLISSRRSSSSSSSCHRSSKSYRCSSLRTSNRACNLQDPIEQQRASLLLEQQRASLLLEQHRASLLLEQQFASLLPQLPLGPQAERSLRSWQLLCRSCHWDCHNNVAATQQLLPQMLHEPAEAPTTASSNGTPRCELSQLLEGEHRPLSASILIFLSCAGVVRADFRTV